MNPFIKFAVTAMMATAICTSVSASEDVTITVDKNHGELTRDGASGTWCNQWTSTATNPGAKLTSTKNDMQWSGNYIDARSGQALSETFTVRSSSKAYYVSAYSFNFKLIGSGAQTLSGGGRSLSATNYEQQWSVANTDVEVSPTFTIDGANDGILLTDFTITLSPIPGYVEEPELLKTTTITNGEFDPQTNWYTLQIAGAEFHLTYEPGATYMQLARTTTEFSDADLWCFTGDDTEGYQIYNKAAGASMMFGAPTTMSGVTGGSSYAIVTTPGRAGYCYDWQLRETDVLGDDTPAFYINEKGATAKTLNNRDGKLAFWTGGVDAGSAVQIKWAQQTIEITPSTGVFLREGQEQSTPAWSSVWNSFADPDFRFATTKNNMYWNGSTIQLASGKEYGSWTFASTEDKFVTAYEFDFVRSGSWGTATMEIALPNDQKVSVTTQPGHVAVVGLTKEMAPDFFLNASPADANKLIDVTNFRATLRRVEKADTRTAVFRFDGTADYNICYRIPAITTVENGVHKGRIVAISDYRYSGADIGNGRIDLYMSYSDDNGLTWSTPDHMRDADGQPVAQGTGKGSLSTSLQNPDCGFGDAAIVSDRESGRLMVISVCGRTPFFSARRSNPNQSAVWYSEDGGSTWSHYELLTDKIYTLFDGTVPYGYIDSEFIGSGRMLQSRYIKHGDYYRVYAVLSGYNYANDNVSNWVLYTDDFGKNWNILGDPMTPPVNIYGDEPKAEELPDGSVLLAGRNKSGNRNFNIFRYTDIENGEGQWGVSVRTDMGMGSINACNGEIMIIPVRNKETEEKCYMALQSFPYGGSRRNVSIAWKTLSEPEDIYSPDAFTKWNGRYRVSSKGSAYSTMCWQHDNTLGFLYEESTFGKDYCCVYRNLSVSELTDGLYEYCEDVDFAIRKSMTSQLIAYRLENELDNTEPGRYVGQTDGRANPQADRAAAAFNENPSADNYQAFNVAMLQENPEQNYISITEGGLYTLLNAHDGEYDFGDRWLTTDGQALLASGEESEQSNFLFIHRSDDSEGWLIYHPLTKSFVGQTPIPLATDFTMVSNHSLGHEYYAQSNVNGHTVLTDVDPADAAASAISLHSDASIVAKDGADRGARWYMAFVRMADESELPDLTQSTIDSVDYDTSATVPVKYYDIYGREVRKPAPGQLLITSDRRKIIIAE